MSLRFAGSIPTRRGRSDTKSGTRQPGFGYPVLPVLRPPNPRPDPASAMARKPRRSKRLEFFRLGNTHCPICLVPFTEESVKSGRGVTLEHAPPKTLGGHATCLTCGNCNQRASATSDQAAKRSKGPPRLQFDINGAKRETRFWQDGIPPSEMPYRFGSSPAAQEAKRELDGQTIVAVTAPLQFDQPATINEIFASLMTPNPRHVEISYLRSAYLLVFSLLGRSGYVWARSDATRLVRANPEPGQGDGPFAPAGICVQSISPKYNHPSQQ